MPNLCFLINLGELIGEALQGNLYKLKGNQWRIFDIWITEQERYATPDERYKILEELGLSENSVPVLGIKKIGGLSVGEILKFAEGSSALLKNAQREGIVFKSKALIDNSTLSFKAISNLWLLKNDK
jgi:ATP-dependent RNA circularization protein (DNA/RNA ligase family)